jgi:hypothetical protein
MGYTKDYMHWIIQQFFKESGFEEMVDILTRLKIPHTQIQVIPFSHELDPKPEIENPIVVMGSTTLVRIAKSYGWGPGVWFNDNFNYNSWLENWGENLLNHDSIVCRFEEIKLTDTMFLRPVDDLKSFSGGLIHPDNFNEWQEAICRYDDGTITKDTMVTIAPPKNIFAEYRCFVIDGRVVTISQYKQGNRVLPTECTDDRLRSSHKRWSASGNPM